MPTAYELQREANIERNKALLLEMSLDQGGASLLGMAPKAPVKMDPRAKRASAKAKALAKKRKTPPPSDSADSDGSSPRKVRVAEQPGGLRRSSRLSGKEVDYVSEDTSGRGRVPVMATKKVGVDHDREPNIANMRKYDPARFGAIPGIPVGTWWETRADCSTDSVHAPLVGGISGSIKGAYSVALSGGYPDDVDLGEAFTFTGSGGRDLKGTKAAPKNLRTAPQTSDQTFENHFNRALKASSETKKPVRVIRGYKCPSAYGPSEGYRYDGLYTVEKAWMAKGKEGFLVCKYAFKRISGQAPLLSTPIFDEEGNDGVDKEEEEAEASAAESD